MRLAIAGETNNVITIGWYTKIIDASIVWAIAWGIYKFFSTSNCGSHKSRMPLVWHCCLLWCAGTAPGLVFVFMLLARNGVGPATLA